MKKSRFDIISDLFKLSNVISESLKLAESLAGKSSGSGETDCKDICRNIRYSLKPLSPAETNGGPRERVRRFVVRMPASRLRDYSTSQVAPERSRSSTQ